MIPPPATLGSKSGTKYNGPAVQSKAVKEFAFVNATTTAPFGNRDPEVSKLVRGQVVEDTMRREKLRREIEGSGEKVATAKPRLIEPHQGRDLGLDKKQSSIASKETTLATLPISCPLRPMSWIGIQRYHLL